MKKKICERIATGQSYWYNFIILCLDNGGFNFSVNMLSHLTIVPYYLSELTNSNLIIGLAPTIFVMGQMLPQVFIANYINGLKQRKSYLLKIVTAERAGILLVFLSVLLFAGHGGALAIATFLFSYAVFTTTMGLTSPAHSDLVARSITRRRGMFYGVSFFFGGVSGIIGARLAAGFLETRPFPESYIQIFGLALIVSLITLLLWLSIMEPKYQYSPRRLKSTEYLRHLGEILRTNKEYTKFLIVRIILNFCEIATPFYIVYAKESFKISSGTVGLLSLIMIVAQTLSHLIWGYVGDRFGFKRVLQMVTLLGLAATLTALTASNASAFFAVFILVGAMYSSVQVANVNLAIEFSSPDQTPTFVGLMNTVQAPALALAPLIGGLLADNFGYQVTITVGLLLFAFAAVFCTLYMKDPRELRKETEESMS